MKTKKYSRQFGGSIYIKPCGCESASRVKRDPCIIACSSAVCVPQMPAPSMKRVCLSGLDWRICD